MSDKAIGIVAYITIIGWIIAFVIHQGKEQKSPQAAFHIEQSLGLIIVAIAVIILAQILAAIGLGIVGTLLNLGVLVLWFFGIFNAIQEKQEPIPLTGQLFRGKFGFVN